jgi:hypothetical protein
MDGALEHDEMIAMSLSKISLIFKEINEGDNFMILFASIRKEVERSNLPKQITQNAFEEMSKKCYLDWKTVNLFLSHFPEMKEEKEDDKMTKIVEKFNKMKLSQNHLEIEEIVMICHGDWKAEKEEREKEMRILKYDKRREREGEGEGEREGYFNFNILLKNNILER